MAARKSKCPKCDGSMEEGFLLDRGHGNTRNVENWVQGPPEPSFWMGIKVSGKKMRTVATWRCGDCGYLESYAT